MVEVHVSLTEEQVAELNRIAKQTGEPLDALVRRGVDNVLAASKADDERIRRFMALAGTFSSGLHDVSVKHDKYLTGHDDE